MYGRQKSTRLYRRMEAARVIRIADLTRRIMSSLLKLSLEPSNGTKLATIHKAWNNAINYLQQPCAKQLIGKTGNMQEAFGNLSIRTRPVPSNHTHTNTHISKLPAMKTMHASKNIGSARRPQDGPKMDPRLPLDGPKMTPRFPKMAPRRPKIGLQMPKMGLQMRKTSLQILPK